MQLVTETFFYAQVLLRLLSFALRRSPRMAYHTLSFYVFGPPRPSWPLSMHLAIKLLKSYLASHSASDLKDVAVVKKLTSIPQKLPAGCSISKERIPPNSSVISFFKDKTFGPFPVDARKPYELRGEWVDTLPKRGKDKIVILIHGGAYVLGSPQMYCWMSFAIAKQANARVLAIRYRLAPKYIFPCAVIDAVTAYLHVLKEYDPASVHLIGDSAGGGLVLATLLAIRDGGWPQPTGAITLSPWLDLTHSLPSFQTNIDTDFLPRNPYGNGEADAQVHLYAPVAELKNPYVSPMWVKDLSRLCPILIQTGEAERLRDESIFLAHRIINETQGWVSLELYQDMTHVFAMFQFLPLAKEGLRRFCAFINDPKGRGERGIEDVRAPLTIDAAAKL